jgi:hypothetical protein
MRDLKTRDEPNTGGAEFLGEHGEARHWHKP